MNRDHMQIIDKFPDEFEILESLFRVSELRDNLLRLEKIFCTTEALWKDRVSLIPNKEVKFLLIGEAPPWTKSGNINYIYNPETKPSIFLQAICKAFFKKLIYEEIGVQETLTMLGDRGFLLCDSIPFAMSYSDPSAMNDSSDHKRNIRNREYYRKLIKMTSRSYLQPKLSNSGINWSNNIKVAFAVFMNGKSLIEALNSKLNLGNGLTLSIDTDHIAVNKAWYPCSNELRRIYEIP
jgi:hypothetical protein